MKKIVAIVVVGLMVVMLSGCPGEEVTNVYNNVTVDRPEGVEAYYNDPNCFVYCKDVGWESITCTDGEGVPRLKIFAMSPDGPCGCYAGLYDCDWWHGDGGN